MTISDSALIKKFKLKSSDKILDIGGSAKQHDKIQVDTLIDIVQPENEPYFPSKLTAKKFVKADITRDKLPFTDNEFDFCFCTHTLEDLYNPFLVISEMSRVAKRGYIATPSRGADMVYSHIDITDWMVGPRRTPGHAHHYWFFEKKGSTIIITPKNYGLLMSPEFQIGKWVGPVEFQFAWNGSIKYRLFMPTNFHELIADYRKFMAANSRNIKKGRTLFFVDNPFYIAKAFAKLLLKRGEGYKFS